MDTSYDKFTSGKQLQRYDNNDIYFKLMQKS